MICYFHLAKRVWTTADMKRIDVESTRVGYGVVPHLESPSLFQGGKAAIFEVAAYLIRMRVTAPLFLILAISGGNEGKIKEN